jgi:uncharacterized membrane protein
MWVLNFLPDWFFYIVLLAGVGGLIASYLMKFIPFVYIYRTPIQLVSVVSIVVGTFMIGAAWNDQAWKDRVDEMEQKVAAAEVKSTEENVKIVTKIVKKTELVRTKGDEVIKYIDREIVKYDERCEIPNELVNALNDAAEQPK